MGVGGCAVFDKIILLFYRVLPQAQRLFNMMVDYDFFSSIWLFSRF